MAEYNITDNEILQYALDSGILDADDVRRQIVEQRNKKYLNDHIHNHHHIWYDEKTRQWMTYLDDPSSRRGFVLRRRRKKKDLENLIIEYYYNKEYHPTIQDVFDGWIALKSDYGEISQQTQTRYTNDFHRFFPEDCLLSMKFMSEITELELETHIKSTIQKLHLTRKTFNGMRIVTKGVFKYAKKRGYTSINISDFFDELELPRRIFAPKKQLSNEEDVFSEEEISLMKDYLWKKDTPRYLGILLDIYTGLRVGELSALKPEDITLYDGYGKIRVCKTEIHYNAPDEDGINHNYDTVQDFPKTEAGNRQVIITGEAVKVVKRIMELNPSPKEYLFEDKWVRIRSSGFSRALHRTCEDLGIPCRSMHKIRKYYASRLLDNHVNDALVTAQMGHSDINVTRAIYQRNTRSEESRAEELERAFANV